jgi:tRNA dimethylallyltransferase
MTSKNKTLISIIGPTAIGKTSLSILLAKHFSTEVISCDSRQFFKEMTIGTAVPSREELATVPHHFIQDRSIFNDYNVYLFKYLNNNSTLLNYYFYVNLNLISN